MEHLITLQKRKIYTQLIISVVFINNNTFPKRKLKSKDFFIYFVYFYLKIYINFYSICFLNIFFQKNLDD